MLAVMNTSTTLSTSEARKRIFEITKAVQQPSVYYTLTENGKPKAVVLSAEEFDSLVETLGIMSDPKILKKVERAETEYRLGEYISWEEVKKQMVKPLKRNGK